MTKYTLLIGSLEKYFGRRLVFQGVNAFWESGSVYGVAGPNGSGKSTLVKIIANLISANNGKIIHKENEKTIQNEKLHNFIGFVSPYLFLYDEFSAEENLIHFSNIRGLKFNKFLFNELMNKVNLYDRRSDLVRGYSSGMKQRLRFVFALLHKPRLIIFDEPTSNLDNYGKEAVYKIIDQERKSNLVIVASNEDGDLSVCNEILNIEDYKG
jgi:heme exporter protein A